MVKKLTRKKVVNKKDIHPLSRKAKQVTKQCAGIKRRDNAHLLRHKKNKAMIDKYKWFQEIVNEYIDSEEGFNCLDHKSLAQLTKKYLARFDEVKAHVSETLPEMNKDLKRHKHTAVNKYAAKTSLFETANAIESNMFKGDGLKVPDLTCKSGLDALIAWDGHENTLPQVKVVLCKASWDKEVSSEM